MRWRWGRWGLWGVYFGYVRCVGFLGGLGGGVVGGLEKIDFVVFADEREQKRLLSRIDINPVSIDENEINELVSFLHSLTGKSKNERPLGKPISVPSGIKVD